MLSKRQIVVSALAVLAFVGVCLALPPIAAAIAFVGELTRSW